MAVMPRAADDPTGDANGQESAFEYYQRECDKAVAVSVGLKADILSVVCRREHMVQKVLEQLPHSVELVLCRDEMEAAGLVGVCDDIIRHAPVSVCVLKTTCC